MNTFKTQFFKRFLNTQTPTLKISLTDRVKLYEEFQYNVVGRDSSVGIATCHGLDGPGIESRWGARFSAPIQTGPVARASLLYNV